MKQNTWDQRLANFVKFLSPEFLHPVLRGTWRKIYSLKKIGSEMALFLDLWTHKLMGGTFQSWYAKKLDQWAASGKKNDVEAARRDEHFMKSGADDLEILKNFGLKPDSTFMEYGCGWLRAASHIINYLEPGKYAGNDASGERIRLGRKIFRLDDGAEKSPTFYINKDNSWDWLEGEKFDFMWCHAVFAHLPEDDIEVIISNSKKAMHENSKFLFTFNPTPTGRMVEEVEVVREDARNWMHSYGYYKELGRRHGLEITCHPDAVNGLKNTRQKECVAVAQLAKK